MSTETCIVLEIPGEPGSKGRARSGRTKSGHTVHYTPEKTVIFENLVRSRFSEIKPFDWTPHEGVVDIEIDAYFPIPKSWPEWKREMAAGERMRAPNRRDWDNIGKAICDALNHIAYRDDRQVTDGLVRKRYSEHPRTEITLTFYPELKKPSKEA
ncbi:MAG TPA: RusA family crossover junction endodeoxyribonuclease [Planctomycetota bacterium]|nr:RusA family crossover junction endodeoxyribonuclease [Planctomycetota bacterium]